MATIRAFTTIEQSHKLAEFLPLKSADMCWFEGEPFVEAVTGYEEERAKSHRQAGMEMYPCWSLTALFSVLPNENMLVKTTDGEYYCLAKDVMTKHYGNPIDACYNLIIKLNELKKL